MIPRHVTIVLALVGILLALAVAISIQTVRHRKALAALRRRTTQYQTLVDLSPDAIFVYRDRKLTFANAAAARLLAASSPADLIGREAAQFVAPEWRGFALEQMAKVMTGPPGTVDAAMLRVDGKRVDVSVSAARIDDDTPPSVLIVVRDVSRFKAAEAKLAESNELLKTVIDASPIAIVSWRSDGVVTIWNRAAEEIFGWPADEVLGQPLPCVPDGLQESFKARNARVLNGEVVKALETQCRRKDGTLAEVNLWTTALTSTHGEETLVALITDISETKKLQAQLFMAQKMEAVGRLAGGVAHDFNNLLTAILGYSELILSRTIDPIVRGEVEEVRRAGQSAALLTRQLLAFSRRQIMQPEIFDLRAHVAERQKMLGRLLGEDIVIKVTLDRSPVLVKADRGQLEQVLMNLAVNARDAMPDGGHLEIGARAVELDRPYQIDGAMVQPGSYALLSVADSGHGMTPDVQKRIFEPFFTTKDRGKGTGLGLATVYGIVKQTEGYIEVASTPGVGSTFTVYLPLAAAPSDDERATTPLSPAAPGTETILLVEDDDSLRELARRSLEVQGYTVLSAPTPTQALLLFDAYGDQIDLLLTDVVMPGMNGRVLADRLQKRRPDLRVLFMSGYTDNSIVHHGVLDAGADFLQKPFVPAELTHRVRRTLSDPASPVKH